MKKYNFRISGKCRFVAHFSCVFMQYKNRLAITTITSILYANVRSEPQKKIKATISK